MYFQLFHQLIEEMLCRLELLLRLPNTSMEAARDYPYAWHLHGRKRLWEIRVQMRLKQVG